jgi:site-specific DNA-methyltransferase (adenine-specific)
MERYLDKVFCGDALRLLRALPTASIDAIVSDPMYGTAKNFQYDWGADPGRGDPMKHWLYHGPIYEECRRVLKPGCPLAWAQGAKFCDHFESWFGGYRLWTLTRFRRSGMSASGHVWIVQTREREPIEFPPRNSLVMYQDLGVPLIRQHPCIKPPEEPGFIIESLTAPGDIVLDCCSGLGSTLIVAKLLGRHWIGCGLSKRYCQIAMQRLAEVDLR